MNTINFIIVVSMVLLATNLIYPQVVNGQNQTGTEEQAVTQEQREALINYCYQHADRPNPIQDLIDKGFLPSGFKETCLLVKQSYNEFEEKYRIMLIEEITNSKCYEVWDPNVSTSQLEALFMGCDRRGLIK